LRSKEEEVVTRLWNGIVKANLTLETAFKIIDKQGQNSVGFNDMMTAFKDLNVEVDARTASEFFKIVDVSDNGSISAAEFYHIFKKYNKQNENVLSPDSTLDWKMELMVRMDRLAKEKGKSLEEIFTDMDEDKNGRISENEFRRIFLKMGIRIQPEEFKNLFFAIDRNRSGEITYPELLDYINVGSPHPGRQEAEREARPHEDDRPEAQVRLSDERRL
jgi:Ca2+-binding EF-hand superfamily protein